MRSHAYAAAFFAAAPGALTWAAFLVGHFFPPTNGPGAGLVLLPFLACFAAIAIWLGGQVFTLPVPAAVKVAVAICNLSFPGYVAIGFITM